MLNLLKKWFKSVYHQLVEISDTPQRKALGLGLGVFLGIFPGMGPIASVVLAALLKVNKAAALLGSVLTNTWMSLVTLTLAVQLGSWLSKTDVTALKESWETATKSFSWSILKDVSLWKTLGAVGLGFLIISLTFALLVYLVAVFILQNQHSKQTVKNK